MRDLEEEEVVEVSAGYCESKVVCNCSCRPNGLGEPPTCGCWCEVQTTCGPPY